MLGHFSKTLEYCLFFGCVAYAIFFSHQRLNLPPTWWKRGVLATAMLGKVPKCWVLLIVPQVPKALLLLLFSVCFLFVRIDCILFLDSYMHWTLCCLLLSPPSEVCYSRYCILNFYNVHIFKKFLLFLCLDLLFLQFFFFKGTYNCCFAFVLRELVADCGRVLNPLLIIPASDSS